MMATIARPSWVEVQDIPVFELEAMYIVRGEAGGDEYLWDAKIYNPTLGRMVTGAWKSSLEKREQNAGPEARRTN